MPRIHSAIARSGGRGRRCRAPPAASSPGGASTRSAARRPGPAVRSSPRSPARCRARAPASRAAAPAHPHARPSSAPAARPPPGRSAAAPARRRQGPLAHRPRRRPARSPPPAAPAPRPKPEVSSASVSSTGPSGLGHLERLGAHRVDALRSPRAGRAGGRCPGTTAMALQHVTRVSAGSRTTACTGTTRWNVESSSTATARGCTSCTCTSTPRGSSSVAGADVDSHLVGGGGVGQDPREAHRGGGRA